jgi:hypothetical protein
MDLNRREVLRWAAAPLFAQPLTALSSVANPGLPGVPNAGLGDVFFCRVSDESLLHIAESLCPRSIVSCEPRPGFHGITFCGSNATLTIPADQLS